MLNTAKINVGFSQISHIHVIIHVHVVYIHVYMYMYQQHVHVYMYEQYACTCTCMYMSIILCMHHLYVLYIMYIYMYTYSICDVQSATRAHGLGTDVPPHGGLVHLKQMWHSVCIDTILLHICIHLRQWIEYLICIIIYTEKR